MTRTIGLVVHRTRTEARRFAGDVVGWLETHGCGVRLEAEMGQFLSRPDLTYGEIGLAEADLLVTLGGDGTILTAARQAAPLGIPILGVHMGRFGFIAETHPDDLFTHLKTILEGEIHCEERLMVQADVIRGDRSVHHGVGLNEALVKSGMSELLQLRTFLRDAPFATYPADGIIVSTPTGSTGYALSAGGPIVEPTVQALVLIPICPHTLSARPMIVPAGEQIEILVLSDSDDMIFAVDGVDKFPLQGGDRVLVRRADYVTHLVTLDNASFYRKIRNRYLYGERMNE